MPALTIARLRAAHAAERAQARARARLVRAHLNGHHLPGRGPGCPLCADLAEPPTPARPRPVRPSLTVPARTGLPAQDGGCRCGPCQARQARAQRRAWRALERATRRWA